VLKRLVTAIGKLDAESIKLSSSLEDAKDQKGLKKQGMGFLAVRKQTQAVRSVVDNLEEIVADRHWPIPKYTDLLVGL
jgi:glutamine synthetase type III